MGAGNYSKVLTVLTGQTITADERNNEHNNHINNHDFTGLDDYSASASEMQTATDPYPGSSVSLPTNGKGELERIRYVLKSIKGSAQWYIPATYDLTKFKILQVITATTASVATTTSSTFQATSLTANITPVSSANKVLILVSGCIQCNTNGTEVDITIARGGSNLMGTRGGNEGLFVGSTGICAASMMYLDSPASTSALTYAVYVKNGDNTSTVKFGDTSITQSIVLMEVAA